MLSIASLLKYSGFYLDLFVCFREFAKEKERVESRAGFMALKESQRLERELTGYVDWICRAGQLLTFVNVRGLIDPDFRGFGVSRR